MAPSGDLYHLAALHCLLMSLFGRSQNSCVPAEPYFEWHLLCYIFASNMIQ